MITFGLTRATNSGAFYPEIDGLRFFAILPVLLDHAYSAYKANVSSLTYSQGFLFERVFGSGELGVQLFFVISGYILSLGFKKAADTNQPLRLVPYYTRRIIRLEPPFLLCTFAFFVVLLLSGKMTIQENWPNLIATILYSHGWIFGHSSLVNAVTWTLEVELQFYLLAPFLFYIYKQQNSFQACIFLVLLVFFLLSAMLAGNYYWTILSHGHFFILGASLPLLKKYVVQIKERDAVLSLAIFLISFFCYFSIEAPYDSFSGNIGKLLFLLIIAIAALNFSPVKKILSFRPIYLTGGMCYSIYLLHYPLLSFISKAWAHIPSQSFSLYLIASLLITLGVSAFFYILVERPFMKYASSFYKKDILQERLQPSRLP